jgi:hypothetical protein
MPSKKKAKYNYIFKDKRYKQVNKKDAECSECVAWKDRVLCNALPSCYPCKLYKLVK